MPQGGGDHGILVGTCRLDLLFVWVLACIGEYKSRWRFVVISSCDLYYYVSHLFWLVWFVVVRLVFGLGVY